MISMNPRFAEVYTTHCQAAIARTEFNAEATDQKTSINAAQASLTTRALTKATGVALEEKYSAAKKET
jgi:hypothetical protein